MSLNVEEIFLRLKRLYNVEKLSELSEKLGYKYNWATTTKNRNKVPWEACAKAAQELNVTTDYIFFGENGTNKKASEENIRIAVTEGIFAAIQTNMITLNKDVKITQLTEIITSEIKQTCDINSNSKEKAE